MALIQLNGPSQYLLDQRKPNYEDQLQQAYDQAKYLAKTTTKELNPKGSWRVTGTRITKKPTLTLS
jgi:hypothetical protein